MTASSPPVRATGTRSRAGNAMARTRLAVLEGAARSLARSGVRGTTMTDIAAAGGVAKGTLYNHFRRREDVFAALAEHEIRALGELARESAGDDLGAALVLAAERIGAHPAVVRIATSEPELLGAMLVPHDGVRRAAEEEVAATLRSTSRDASPPYVDVVVRWLLSYIAQPGESPAAGASVLVAGLPDARS
jgi:AcrR family transcriptional regulator